MAKVAVIDYDSGNLHSVHKALESVGADAVLTRDPGFIREAAAVVLPGQGAFRDCANKLQEYGLWDVLREKIDADAPFLGICVGFQLLFEESEEHGTTPGFGVLKGRVVRFPHEFTDGTNHLKVPHMGWNSLKKEKDVDILSGVKDGDYVYFVHSYHPVVDDPSVIATTTNYGYDFVSSVARGNLFACQFHPEKSQRVGITILQSFWNKVKGLDTP